MRGRYRIEVTRCEEEQIFAPERDDLQLPDIPFAPIDQHPAISTLKLCWSFFFTSPVVPPESCVLKRSLSETLRYFPLSRKVVDWPLFPSLSGRKSDDLGVYWKEVDVLYRREKEEEEKERNKEIEKMMERVERETKPLTIPRRSCMAVKKTNIRSFTRGKEEKWVVLTFFVKHYACDGDSMKTFLSFFCRIIQEQVEQRQRLQHGEHLLFSKQRVREIQLPTSTRLEYFQLSKREKVKVKEHGEFIAYPQLIEHGCVKIKPWRALCGVLVGGFKCMLERTARIQIKLSDDFIRIMKARTARLAPVEDYIVEDDYVSSNDVATAFCWRFLSLLNERKDRKRSTKKKFSYANIAINYRNYGILPKNYFGNASFAHVVAVDDVHASMEKRAREIRRSLQKYREGDPRANDSRAKVRLALGSLDNISFREHVISLHCILNSLDLSATNWTTFDFYNLEFGRGVKATHFDGYVTPRVPNSCAILPARDGNGCTLVVEIKKSKLKKAARIVREMLTRDDADNRMTM